VPERQAVLGGGDFCGDEQRRAGVGARQRASLSDSPRLFERSERSERSEFCGATPDRAAQCSRSEAQTATAWAPGGYRLPRRAHVASKRLLTNGYNGPQADTHIHTDVSGVAKGAQRHGDLL